MKKLLEGRRVLLTGASRGVGLAVARKFLMHGAEVLGTARDSGRLEAVAENLDQLAPGKFTYLVADLNEKAAPERLSQAVARRWGALDILVNNAGVMLSHAASFEQEAPNTLERSLAVNLLAPFHLSLSCLPLLKSGHEPRIILVGSGAGNFASVAEKSIPSYRLSKWALHGLALSLAGQLAPSIAVNAFDPGWVKTDLAGSEAPGSVEESAEGALKLATLPFSEHGKFYKDGNEISF